MLDGCCGVKTGFTKATGRCLVSAVEQNGWKAVCVTLNASDDWNDHKQLFNYVFDKYSLTNIIKKDSIIKSIKTDGTENGGAVDVVITEDVSIVLSDEEHVRMDMSKISDSLNLPVEKYDSLGDVQFFLDNDLIAVKKAVASNNMPKPEKIKFWDKVCEVLNIWARLCS